jgi:hypothetical protein
VGSVRSVGRVGARVVGSHREVVVRGFIGEMMVYVLVRGLVGLVVVLLDVPLLVLNTGLGEMITTLVPEELRTTLSPSWCSYSLHGTWEIWWQGNDVC